VEMHHIRKVNDVRTKYKEGNLTFKEYTGAFLRKQIPLCKKHHIDLHNNNLTKDELYMLAN